MKKQSLLALTGLLIITFGLYGIFWLYRTQQEMVRKGARIPNFGWLLLPWFVMSGTLLLGAMYPESGNIPIVFSWLAIFAIIWWFWPYSKAVELVTNKQLEAVLVYIFIIFLGAIGFILIQYYFNKLPDGQGAAFPLSS